MKYYYKFVRHPIMTGFIGMMFLNPYMTVNHFVFSSLFTLYIAIAVYNFEEPDLCDIFSDGQYEEY